MMVERPEGITTVCSRGIHYIRVSFCLILSLQKTVNLYPFQIHSVALSSFASLIGPFGGFFASGFKRAFKIKVSLTIFFLW